MSGSKRIVHFLSASDRINYGDLLFPILFQKVAEKRKENIKFYNYGIIATDLSFFKALPTLSYRTFLRNVKKEGGTVVIGGGEVFFASWKTLYSYVSPLYTKMLKNRFFRKLDSKVNFVTFLLGSRNVALPFSPSPIELRNKDVKIIYNSGGGVFPNNNKTKANLVAANNLSQAAYISVRDERTCDSLRQFQIKSEVFPDSAIIISDFFNKDSLINQVSKRLLNEKIPNRYFFIQFGKGKTPEDFNKLSRKLEQILVKFDAEAILCPIGLASLHEDDAELQEFSNYSNKFHFVMPNHIFDIMWLIANSYVYLGTSLHGVITAMSFDVPFFALSNKVGKTDSYCKTWASGVSKGSVSYEELDTISKDLENWNYNLMTDRLKFQKEMVYRNYDAIFRYI